MKPATIFGPEDRFLNWIAETQSRAEMFPLLDGGNTLVQPVFANDVGKALMAIVEVKSTYFLIILLCNFNISPFNICIYTRVMMNFKGRLSNSLVLLSTLIRRWRSSWLILVVLMLASLQCLPGPLRLPVLRWSRWLILF